MKKFQNDELTEAELKDQLKKVEAIQNEFIEMAPSIMDEMDRLKAGQISQLEVRQVNLPMPPLFWKVFDQFIELFEATELAAPEDTKATLDPQMKLIAGYMSQVDVSLQEVILSQATIDACVGFAKDVVRTHLFIKMKDAIDSKDPAKLAEVIDTIKLLNLTPGELDELNTPKN